MLNHGFHDTEGAINKISAQQNSKLITLSTDEVVIHHFGNVDALCCRAGAERLTRIWLIIDGHRDGEHRWCGRCQEAIYISHDAGLIGWHVFIAQDRCTNIALAHGI